MKNKWLLLLALIIVITVYFVFFSSEKVEYSELIDGPHLRGNPEASIVLVEYCDFHQSACGSASYLAKELLEQFQDNLGLEYRHFISTTVNTQTTRAAEASECAADQNKFWEYHDILFLNQDNFSKKDLNKYALKIDGLDLEIWQDCLESGVKSIRVKEDIEEAKQLGYNLTPTFVLNGQMITDYQSLSKKIQSLLEPLIPLQEEATPTQSYLRDVRFSL